MLKFLVIVFFLKHLKYLFTGDSLLKKYFKKLLESQIEYDGDFEMLTKNNPGDIIFCGLLGVGELILWFIDLIVCFFLLKYDQTYITIIFIILTLVNLIIFYIKGNKNKFKKSNKLDKEKIHKLHIQIEEIDKTTFKKIIIRIINAAYWSYAIYLMFLM